MKLKLFPSVIFGILLIGCSQTAKPTDTPVPATQIPPVTLTPTITTVPATSTPRPTATKMPTATDIVPGAVLFEENFEDGKADHFVYIAGGWFVTTESNGNKVFEINTNTETAIKNNEGGGIGFGSEDWTNYSAEYRVKMLNWKANTWLNFRSTMGDNQEYYNEWLSAEYDSLTLSINQNYGPWENLKWLDLSVRDERWYRIKVEAQGSDLRVYLDDTLMIQAEDARVERGGFDLGVMSVTHALFDDIRVIALGDRP